MIIYYSGNSSNDAIPEVLIREKSPAIMLTFWDFFQGARSTERRFKAHRNNLRTQNKTKRKK